MMVEVFADTVEEVMKYYGSEEDPLADFPFNFFLIDNFHGQEDLSGESLMATVSLWLDNLPAGKWPNWVLGNHNNNRVSSRLGTDLIDALNMMALLLPGTPVTYYGEEIGEGCSGKAAVRAMPAPLPTFAFCGVCRALPQPG
uniref:Glycosyl hydrolase family 13 catalytic domain-containing protein n=1 Tax=Scylla olivacea TaxID=85551 RepID=A0A0P4VX34_SCYOL